MLSQSAKKGRDRGKKLLQDYLATSGRSMSRLSSADCCQMKFFEDMAVYLVNWSLKDEESLLKPSTVKKYFSNAKNYVKSLFPTNEFWEKITTADEFAKLIGRIEHRISARHIELGLNTADKSPPIMRFELKEICQQLLKIGTKQSFLDRCYLTCIWQAVGRGGEISLSTWKGIKWIPDLNGIQWEWKEIKTERPKAH